MTDRADGGSEDPNAWEPVDDRPGARDGGSVPTEEELRRREEELDRREEKIEEEERKLNKRKRQLDEERDKLEEDEKEILERRNELSDKEERLEEREEGVKESERDLQEREQELTQYEQELEKREAELQALEEFTDEAIAELSETADTFTSRPRVAGGILFAVVGVIAAAMAAGAFTQLTDAGLFVRGTLLVSRTGGLAVIGFLAVASLVEFVGAVLAYVGRFWPVTVLAGIISILVFFPVGVPATVMITVGESQFD